jgi:hypothetical protein
MGIKHRADNGFRKFRLLLKFVSGGQLSAPKCPTFHTRDRYGQTKNDID